MNKGFLLAVILMLVIFSAYELHVISEYEMLVDRLNLFFSAILRTCIK